MSLLHRKAYDDISVKELHAGGLHVARSGPGPHLAQGLGLQLVTQLMFGSRLGLGPVQIITVGSYRENFGLSQAILFFAKKELFIVVLILCSWHC
jgi:hypothetical protein